MAKKAIMSVEEKHRLEELEAIIKKDLKGFIRVGMALKNIKEEELWRGEYDSFEDYVKKVWDLGKTYAYDQIKAFNVVENLKAVFRNCGNESLKNDGNNCSHLKNAKLTSNELILPQNESQARPLTALQPIQQRIAWQKVIKRTEGKPTALAVRKVVEKIMGQNIEQGVDELKVEASTTEGIPDDFNEAFNQMANVVAKHRKLGWKGIKRKEALKLINALTSYFE